MSNQYLHNGKELQDELNLGLYDFGARFYDGTIGRRTTPDPLAEKYLQFSPYSYVANNPLIYFDPDGKRIYFVNASGELKEATRTMIRTVSGRRLYNKYVLSDKIDVYIGNADFGKNREAAAMTSANAHDGIGRNGTTIVNSRLKIDNRLDSEEKKALSAFQNVDFAKSKGKVIHLISVSNEALKEHDKYTMAESIFHELKAHIDINTGDSRSDHKQYG